MPQCWVDSSPTIDAKRALRSEMRKKRAALTDRDERSALIWANVLRLCKHVASALPSEPALPLTVLAFSGVGSEPDTSGLITLLHAHGYTVGLPRVADNHLVAARYRPGDTLRAGAYNIPEPLGDDLDPETIDVVIVPGLAFTRDGRRLGQGGGYYDRFLPQLRPDCVVCGVGFSEQVVDDLPSEPHDRTLSSVITDTPIEGDLAE